MKARTSFVTVIALTLALLLPSGAAAVPRMQMGAPGLVNYQGYLTDDDDPVDGQVDLRFGIYETETSATALWEETHEGVTVADGHFAVLLGSVTPLSASAFSGTERWLQVSADLGGGYTDLPRQRVTAVPYALQAQEAASAPWSGLSGVPSGLDDGDDVGGDYAHVVVVAKSGGDHTSVQAAIDSITDASSTNPYLVWVAPGKYNETVTLKENVHLRGSGQGATVVSGSVSNEGDVVTATVTLAGYSSLRGLTVRATGVYTNVAVRVPGGTKRALVADVRTEAEWGTNNYAIYMAGGISTSPTLLDVVSWARDASGYNVALEIVGAQPTVRGGSFHALGGERAFGIRIQGSGADVAIEGTIARGSVGSITSVGLVPSEGATVTVYGGSFAGDIGGTDAGVRQWGSGTTTSISHSVLEGADYAATHSDGGTLVIAHSRLVGGAVSGSPTCVAVSRGSSFGSTSCP